MRRVGLGSDSISFFIDDNVRCESTIIGDSIGRTLGGRAPLGGHGAPLRPRCRAAVLLSPPSEVSAEFRIFAEFRDVIDEQHHRRGPRPGRSVPRHSGRISPRGPRRRPAARTAGTPSRTGSAKEPASTRRNRFRTLPASPSGSRLTTVAAPIRSVARFTPGASGAIIFNAARSARSPPGCARQCTTTSTTCSRAAGCSATSGKLFRSRRIRLTSRRRSASAAMNGMSTSASTSLARSSAAGSCRDMLWFTGSPQPSPDARGLDHRTPACTRAGRLGYLNSSDSLSRNAFLAQSYHWTDPCAKRERVQKYAGSPFSAPADTATTRIHDSLRSQDRTKTPPYFLATNL
jgi:hypothetical protein